MNPRLFLDVDPRTLHLPASRWTGAEWYKLQTQIARFGSSMKGMPTIECYRGPSGRLVIGEGVTRATRIAKLLPGTLVRVEVLSDVSYNFDSWPTVGDFVP